MSFLVAGLLSLTAATTPTAEQIYSRVEKSVFTIEVHTGTEDSKSVIGSGYLVSPDGNIVTNYHVVNSYIEDPDRHKIRIKNKRGTYPARLLHFDLINDLALLQANNIEAPPLKFAKRMQPAVGSSIVALGNPHGLRMSIIRGLFNGFSEKGLIDRMLFSMPLNSGMSGGPILNLAGNIIGTNVSVIWLSNSVSFGVPGERLRNFLSSKPIASSKSNYRKETERQLHQLEESTFQKVIGLLDNDDETNTIDVGGAQMLRLPKIFDCWDSSKKYKDREIDKAKFGCNLQFTPSVKRLGRVASIELFVEHISTTQNPYGFYGYLGEHGDSHHEISHAKTFESARSSPKCTVDRVTVNDVRWKLNTCVNAYIDYQNIYDFALVGTTVSRSDEAIHLAVHMKGFHRESFRKLAHRFLNVVRFSGDRS